jgi:hypothetical protein
MKKAVELLLEDFGKNKWVHGARGVTQRGVTPLPVTQLRDSPLFTSIIVSLMPVEMARAEMLK